MDRILNPEIFIVDSWPLLEHAFRPTPLPKFDRIVRNAHDGTLRLLMSEINLGEVFYLVEKDMGIGAGDAVVRAIHVMPIEIIAIQPGDGMDAARLKAQFPLSYADCFCANLAIRNAARVLTGDSDFLRLQRAGLLQVEWLGA